MSEHESQSGDRDGSAVDDQVNKSSNNGQEFPWKTKYHSNDEHRIFVKEVALEDGIEQCEKLIDEIRESFDNIENLDDAFARSIWSLDTRKQWISDCEDIIKTHQDFRVLVGVTGRTGSGKTSALNAVLGFQELLPTSNEEASTAVPCKIEYNHDNDPSRAFRCQVTFRKKADLRKQLDDFFEDIIHRNELRGIPGRSHEDEHALRNYNAQLKPTFELIKTVFGIDEEQAEEMNAQTILSSRPEVLSLLGTTKKFHHHESKGISDKIKPYMDSTEADHGKTGLHFAAWPLIDEVALFAKSDILKNGVVLVDLPGVADAVESRAAVGERYFGKLAALLIMVEVKRAASDSSNVSIMSKHHEMAMMMDGKFHRRRLCVCVTQIDLLDRPAALRKKDARDNNTLQSLLRREQATREKRQERESKKKEADKLLKSLEKTLKRKGEASGKAKAKGKVKKVKKSAQAEANAKLVERRKYCRKIDHQVLLLKEEINELASEIQFICIKARNVYLEPKLQKHFAERQARLLNPNEDRLMEAYDGKASICPISAKAFWECRQGQDPMIGFPDETYSGIPNLATWIRTATIPEREEHADVLFNRLRTKYNVVRLWSRDEWNRSRIKISRECFERNVIDSAFALMIQAFDGYWRRLGKTIEKKNPLNNKNGSFEKCSQQCADAVVKWTYRNPDDDTSSGQIHWLTYRAMIKRKGAKFISKSGDTTREYDWMQDISHVLLNKIVKEWNQSLNHDIPALATLASPEIDKIWGDFLQCLEIGVKDFNMSMWKDLQGEISAIEDIKDGVKDQLRRVLRDISRGATKIHPDLVKVVQKQWEPAFTDALTHTGSGSHKRRKEVLLDFAKTSSQATLQAAFANMQDKLNVSFKRTPEKLAEVSSFAVRATRDHISVLLDRIIEPDINNPVKLENVEEMKVKMQQRIQAVLLDWDLKWKMADRTYKFIDTGESKLPETYRHIKVEQAIRYDNDDDDDDIDMDIDTA
ncbi:hypothetical protein GGR51DRAFT_571944 [Nemania sp. FL0031]|nr:hypothetical protein GGR51DRAFT_571944 [Nemania sp. FL0031]